MNPRVPFDGIVPLHRFEGVFLHTHVIHLRVLQELMNVCINNGWAGEREWIEDIIPRPYMEFDETLVEASQHELPQVDIPPHVQSAVSRYDTGGPLRSS